MLRAIPYPGFPQADPTPIPVVPAPFRHGQQRLTPRSLGKAPGSAPGWSAEYGLHASTEWRPVPPDDVPESGTRTSSPTRRPRRPALTSGSNTSHASGAPLSPCLGAGSRPPPPRRPARAAAPRTRSLHTLNQHRAVRVDEDVHHVVSVLDQALRSTVSKSWP